MPTAMTCGGAVALELSQRARLAQLGVAALPLRPHAAPDIRVLLLLLTCQSVRALPETLFPLTQVLRDSEGAVKVNLEKRQKPAQSKHRTHTAGTVRVHNVRWHGGAQASANTAAAASATWARVRGSVGTREPAAREPAEAAPAAYPAHNQYTQAPPPLSPHAPSPFTRLKPGRSGRPPQILTGAPRLQALNDRRIA